MKTNIPIIAKDSGLVPVTHANFIINHQESAIDAQIHLVQTKVREQTTIELIHEVHIIGDC